MKEVAEIRIHGKPERPALVYLPGIHGDWTLVASLRAELAGAVRFVEFTYPRTVRWSLTDYAREVLRLLAAAGISEGWILAESFGSQVAWPLLAELGSSPGFRVRGLILAGGFVRYPVLPLVGFAEAIVRWLPPSGLEVVLWIYGRYARFRHRSAPETLEQLEEFVERRRHPQERASILHRLKLIADSDPRPLARATTVPVWWMTGFWDPIVPWPPVRAWLRRECPALQSEKVLFWADHTVLATQPAQAAEQIAEWMGLTVG